MTSKSIDHQVVEWVLAQSETCKRDILSGKLALMPVDVTKKDYDGKPTMVTSRNLVFRADRKSPRRHAM